MNILASYGVVLFVTAPGSVKIKDPKTSNLTAFA